MSKGGADESLKPPSLEVAVGAPSRKNWMLVSRTSRGLPKSCGADSIRALFVFLDLLERDAKMLTQLALTQPEHHPAHPQPRPDIDVDHV